MIYRPKGERFLWDTWLFPWQDKFHLFFLESAERTAEWTHIGRALSEDLVHWEELPSIPVPQGAPGSWDESPTLTGMVVRHGAKFWMFYGAKSGRVQRIGLMSSDDLLTWRPFEHNPVLVPGGRHYQATPDSYGNAVDWRDPYVSWRQDWGAYEALVCARAGRVGVTDSGTCVARCRSKDLIGWEYLPPAAMLGELFLCAEVPDYFELKGKHYILFSSQSGFGRRLDTATRRCTTGTYYVMADRRDGDYRAPADPLLLGSGCGRKDAIVGRTLDHQGRRLLYHHMYGDRPTWGAPKLVGAQDDGTLFLEYWPGVNRLERGKTRQGFGRDLDVCREPGCGKWSLEQGRLGGRSVVRNTTCYLQGEVSDFHLTCQLRLGQAARAGVAFRVDPERRDETRLGTAIVLDAGASMAEWGRLTYSDVVCVEDEAAWRFVPDQPVRLRILARGEHIELYLDDRWLFSAHVEELPPRGRLAFMVEAGEAAFEQLRVAELEPFS